MIKWLPWQFFARRAAKAYGFADPIHALERVRRFSHPSETHEPIELLRAGFAFHARGLANTKAIQNNLDWVWPYWVQRQFDPLDASFVPRAFSFSHINLTHRNWTAVGLPDCDRYAVVDPRGLVTPFHDAWSIDVWLLGPEGELFPSKAVEARQELQVEPTLRVVTAAESEGLALRSTAQARRDSDGEPVAAIEIEAASRSGGYAVVAARPYNPEGVRFIDRIEGEEDGRLWIVDGDGGLRIEGDVERGLTSNYRQGDLPSTYEGLERAEASTAAACAVGMATAASLVPLEPAKTKSFRVFAAQFPVGSSRRTFPAPGASLGGDGWTAACRGSAALEGGPEWMGRLYERALRTLVLLSPDDLYPGPYTYRRFWFRDACLMAQALLAAGQVERCRRAAERFAPRQTRFGYFRSQEGEWDSNGQVLWLFDRFERVTGQRLSDATVATVWPAVRWIERKRVGGSDPLTRGLLPAGFSAEHFGPNDYYYWDDFWAVAGLQGAAALLGRHGRPEDAETARALAVDLRRSVEESIVASAAFRRDGCVPASPHRRMDSGAIGSLVADYPLQLYPVGEPRMRRTAERLLERHFVEGAFFQDMIHSGLNVYLTLALAQSLLRAGDARWLALAERSAALASPTGQWPEAIHPRTLGGCMGDGQHGWAAAEWIMLVRNAFLREEGAEALELGAGLQAEWLAEGKGLRFGPTPTPFGPAEAAFSLDGEGALRAAATCPQPRGGEPLLRLAAPGFERVERRGWGELRARSLGGGRSESPADASP